MGFAGICETFVCVVIQETRTTLTVQNAEKSAGDIETKENVKVFASAVQTLLTQEVPLLTVQDVQLLNVKPILSGKKRRHVPL